MSSRRITTLALCCLGSALLLGAVLAGCESKPAAPEFANPFDPDSPGDGDPLDLSATFLDSVIIVTWSQPQGLGISSYDVSHSFQPGAEYDYLDTVDHTTAPTNRFTYVHPLPTATHYFRVQAFSGSGAFSIVSSQVPAAAATPPSIVVGNDPARKTTASRFKEVVITVTMEDSFLVAGNKEFTGAFSYPVLQPGQPQQINWDFGPAANGDTVSVFAKAFTGATSSATAAKHLKVDFTPDFTVRDAPATVASRLVDLLVPDAGVEMMRFASSLPELAAAAWVPAAEYFLGFLLRDSAAVQTVYGEFQGDFGFNVITDLAVTPDLLQNVSFKLDLPADNVTGSPTVRGVSSATALLMRFSTRPDFTSAPWQAYADTADISLGTEEGQLTVYAQYRNDWNDSAILTDTVIHVQKPLSVRFNAPGDGAVLLGGVPLQVQGTSSAVNGVGAIDSVKVDFGDGLGFRLAAGTNEWSLLWGVPLFTADTPLTLRARAWAGVDFTTAVINVTVSQITVSITSPVNGAEIVSDTEVTITGAANGALGGHPVDLVTLAIGEENLTATGTNPWTATWQAPAVTEPTALTITATAWALNDQTAQSITITVVPE